MSGHAVAWSIEWARLSDAERRRYFLATRCETCAALEGQWCTARGSGFPTHLPHKSRMAAAMKLFNAETVRPSR